MTDAELTELEALCHAATPGPWECDIFGIPGVATKAPNRYRSKHIDELNFAFIAAARTAVPALIAEVRKLREELEAADRYCGALERNHPAFLK
jgi:hypothetical protein